MNRVLSIVCITALFAGNLLAENLGSKLKESGWDRILGQWVDAETGGQKHNVTYEWKFKDQVVEINTHGPEKEGTALMGYNPKSGDVFHVGADSDGGSSIGKWTVEDGDAVLGLLFVSGAGEEGALQLRHTLKDENTLIVTVVLPEPIVYELVRK